MARSQVLGSWATASSRLRDLARQPASQHPGVGEGGGRSLNAAQGGVGGTFGSSSTELGRRALPRMNANKATSSEWN